MRPIRPVLAAALLAATAPAWPQQAPADDAGRAALAARVAALEEAVRAGDVAGSILDFMPERLKARMAADDGVTVPEFEAELRGLLTATLAGTSTEVRLDLDAATHGTTPDGTRAYALIPARLVIRSSPSGYGAFSAAYLAFEDEGRWHLLPADDLAALAALEDAYPEFDGAFDGVLVPPGATKAIE